MNNSPLELIHASHQVLILIHLSPDADALGSGLALARALRRMGKRARIVCLDPLPAHLKFLASAEDLSARHVEGEDLAVALDSSDVHRFGPSGAEVAAAGIAVLNIDHHSTNQYFGTHNLVRPEAAATAEIVYDLLVDLGVEIDAGIATGLLAGLVSDTRGFRTVTTTPHTLELATGLMRAGADLTVITEQLLEQRDLSTVRLWGKIIGGVQLEGRIVWAVESLEMRRQLGAADAGDGVVNLLATVKEADVAILFRETNSGPVEVSLRSRRGANVARIAQRFAGGGHPQAAGCSVSGDLQEVVRRVLAVAQEELSLQATSEPTPLIPSRRS